jgi:uncharacterized protein YcaQ
VNKPVLLNADARRLFLHKHALAEAPQGPSTGADLTALIMRLGFVQLDSINTIERAHHMILFARRPSYRPPNLHDIHDNDRSLFEHWTHDASVIPTAFYPHWHLRFHRDTEKLRKQWKNWRRDGFEGKSGEVMRRIREEGPCCSGDVGKDEAKGSGGWWDWHPSKTALEYLWRSGDLTVTYRKNFKKFYDLTERVLDQSVTNDVPEPEASIDWLCNAVMDRLGFATPAEIASFWDTVTNPEARAWCAAEHAAGRIIEVDVQSADKSLRTHFARPDVTEQACAAPTPPARVRVLSPFDPALRDRKRTERLFGFQYRIEVFVPAAKRQYGYYVFPVMEGARMIGRIDANAPASDDTLNVTAFWPETDIKMTPPRTQRLEAELMRLARFAGKTDVVYKTGWQRATDPFRG